MGTFSGTPDMKITLSTGIFLWICSCLRPTQSTSVSLVKNEAPEERYVEETQSISPYDRFARSGEKFSRILRGDKFSRIVRSNGNDGFLRILRGDEKFARILRGDEKFARILRQKEEKFARILRGDQKFARILRSDEKFARIMRQYAQNYGVPTQRSLRSSPEVKFVRILRSVPETEEQRYARILREDPESLEEVEETEEY